MPHIVLGAVEKMNVSTPFTELRNHTNKQLLIGKYLVNLGFGKGFFFYDTKSMSNKGGKIG